MDRTRVVAAIPFLVGFDPMEANHSVLESLISLAPPIPCGYPDGEAGAFLRNPASQPMSLLVGAIALYGSDSPWALPHGLYMRLGMDRFDASTIAAIDVDKMRRAVGGLHMDPSKMAKWIQRAAQVVVGQYGGGTNWIWNDYRRMEATQLVRRLLEMPGIGSVKALMFAFLLRRDWGADVVGWEKLQVPVNDAMRETAGRLGISIPQSNDPEQLVRMYEGLRNIAKTFCLQGRPLCDACPFSTKCPKQGV